MTGRQHSIVPHKANYFFIPLEDDYLAMYEDLAKELDPIKERNEEKLSGPSDCKAMIASVLEAWMNSKRPTAKDENGLYVYLTYDEWEQALRYRYKRSTIIQCLKEMEAEGEWVSEDGTEYQGTVKKRHFVQNTFEYQLNLPVVLALMAQLPEQSPFEQKPRPSLGRPNKNRPKINGLNKNGLNLDDRDVKTNDGSVKIDGQSVKTNEPFYTHITQTKQTYTEGTEASANASPTPALVSHPEYGFLWFDDPVTPSHMVVRLTPEYPHPYHSPDEDKRRERIAGWEVEPYLKARGLNVSVIFMHDLGNETTVEATPAHSHDSYSHSPTEDEHDNNTAGRNLLSARSTSGHNDSGRDSHSQGTAGHPNGTAQPEQVAQRELAAASERVAPSAATPDSGYEKDDEETVKTPVVRVPAQQLSTSAASSAQGSGKVSAHVEPKVLDVRTLTLKAHASYIFQWLDIVKREAKRDGRACYARTKTDEGRIVDLITSCWNSAKELTEENVRKAWLKMWNEPTWKNGFSWKKAGISIKAFCEHYSDYLEKAWDSEQKSEGKGSANSTSALPSYGHMSDAEYAAFLRG